MTSSEGGIADVLYGIAGTGERENLCYYLKELRTRSRIVGWVEGVTVGGVVVSGLTAL